MAFAHFESAQPSGGALFSSGTVRNNFNSLYQGDLSPLRARAQDTPDLTVQVGGGLVENYYQQVWFNNNGTPSNYAGGNSPTIATPSVKPRIALLTLDRSGVLAWTYGGESDTPSAPNCPINEIPIAYVYERVGMTQIVNYEDRASYPSGGYLYRDIRPFMTPASYLEDVQDILVSYDDDDDDLIGDTELLDIIADWSDNYVSARVVSTAIELWTNDYKISEMPANIAVSPQNLFAPVEDLYCAKFVDYTTYTKGVYFDTQVTRNKGVKKAVASIATSTPLTYKHNYVLANATSGNILVTLPDAADHIGRFYGIKKTDVSANTVTVIASGAQLIDASGSRILSSQYQAINIISDGSNWYEF